MPNGNGCVYLVGAGPGDPDLLTQKAARLLKSADVVVFDRLVSPEIIDLVPSGTARLCVGKEPSHHPVPQEEINHLLVRLARSNRKVVRLKGGDPFIFGRGSEEAIELTEHGVRFEIVPGITAAQGCSAAHHVPLTHRGLATGVRYLTGHCRQDLELDFDWQGLADPDTTLVVYMGRANIADIANKLVTHDSASRLATLRLADLLDKAGLFAGVDQCFLEEVPFVDERIATVQGPAIVVGLFAGEGMPKVRTSNGPDRRHRARLWREYDDRYIRTPSRSGRAQRASTLPRRAYGTGSSLYRQPRAGSSGRSRASQFRRVLLFCTGLGSITGSILGSP